MRLFILLALVSFNAFALQWADLDVYETYTLQQGFQLQQKERSGSMLDFSKGQKLRLIEKKGMIGLVFLNFNYIGCSGNQMETEVEVIPVKNSPIEIGAVAMPNCELWMYVDAGDYWTESILK
jgi:hypothetical protein